MSATEEPQTQEQNATVVDSKDSANGVQASVEDTTPKGATDSTPKDSSDSPADGDVQTSQAAEPCVDGETLPAKETEPPKAEEPVAEEIKTEDKPENGEADVPTESTAGDVAVVDEGQGEVATEGEAVAATEEETAKPAEGDATSTAEGEATTTEDVATPSEDAETTTVTTTMETTQKADEAVADGESVTVTETTTKITQKEHDAGDESETVTVTETVTVVKTTQIVDNMTEEIDQILKEMTESGGATTETKPGDEVDNKGVEESQPAEEVTTETTPPAPCADEDKKGEDEIQAVVEQPAETSPPATEGEVEGDKKDEEEIQIVVEEATETSPPIVEAESTEIDGKPEGEAEDSGVKEEEEKGGAESEEPVEVKDEELKVEEQEDKKEEDSTGQAKDEEKEDEEKAEEKPCEEETPVITEVETETPIANEAPKTVVKKLTKRQLRSAGRRVVPQEQPAAGKPDEEDEDIEALTNKLKVKSIDLRSYSNQKAHHTDDYDVPNVVLRRGQLFEIKVGFEQPVKLDDNKSELNLVISLGESPRVTNDTRITIPVGTTVKKWRVDLLGLKEEDLTLRIQSPADAPVGKLNIGISAVLKPTDDPLQWKYVNLYEHDEHLYLLFNPWCRDDVVFLDNEESRQEHVLNDGGLLFEGSHSNPKPRPWNFGQFDTFVVLASIHLLEKGLSVTARSSPIKVVRAMSAMVNAEDDDGVLIANWSGNYDNGKCPSEWAGSVEILSTYMVREAPIGYAQCGEFSGVLTSVLRCLGIPARSVTAYSSAQDSDGSMTVDVHWNHEYQPYAEYNTDTVWVYHTYNECYMARPDLHKGKKLRGWQVVDGTPAERSDGIFQTGPSPVPALRRGNVAVKHDSEYAFAMVNADRVHWMIQETGGSVFNKRLLHKEPSSVGRRIVTKAVGNDDIENITSSYKYAEGSKEERRAVNNACSHGTVHKKYFENIKNKDFDMKLTFDRRVKLGDDVNLKMRLTNKTDVEQQVEIFVECYGTNYTGILQDICRKEKLEATMPPGHKAKNQKNTKEKIMSGVVTAVGSLRRSTSSHHQQPDPVGVTDVAMTIYYDDYKSFISDHTALKFFIVAVRKEPRRHEIALQDEIMLQTPSLKMTVADPSKLKRDEEFSVDMTFTNPLPITLTDCRFNIEGLRFQQAKIIQQGDIEAESEIKVSFNLTPKLAGRKVLVATLHTKELKGISGSLQLEIQL